MTPEEYIERLEHLVTEVRDQDALDFATGFQPAVQASLTVEQLDYIGGMLEGSAMAVAMLKAEAREGAGAGAVSPAERLASHG